MIACADCQFFTPDQVGDGTGIGQCKQYQDYLAKNPSEANLRRALLVLGNKPHDSLFWGAILKTRDCERFKRL